MNNQEEMEVSFIEELDRENYNGAKEFFEKIEDPLGQITEVSLVRFILEKFIKTKNTECIELMRFIVNTPNGFSYRESDLHDIELWHKDFDFFLEAIGYDQLLYKDDNCLLMDCLRVEGLDNNISIAEMLILKGQAPYVLSLIKEGKIRAERAITRATIVRLLRLVRVISRAEAESFINIIRLSFKNTKGLLTQKEIKNIEEGFYILEEGLGQKCKNKQYILTKIKHNIIL